MLFGTLFTTANLLQTIGDRFLGEVTTKQWFLMMCLARLGDKTPTLSELVPCVGSSRQNIKQLALKLQEKGFITMHNDPDDSRALRLALTPAAWDYWQNRVQADALFMDTAFEGIADHDIQKTREVLEQFERNLQQMQKEIT